MIADVANFYGDTVIALEKDCAEDILAKLELAKSNMAMIVDISSWYAIETGNSFPQMLRIGIMSVIESAKGFNDFHHTFMKNANKALFEGGTQNGSEYDHSGEATAGFCCRCTV